MNILEVLEAGQRRLGGNSGRNVFLINGIVYKCMRRPFSQESALEATNEFNSIRIGYQLSL